MKKKQGVYICGLSKKKIPSVVAWPGLDKSYREELPSLSRVHHATILVVVLLLLLLLLLLLHVADHA